MSPVHHQMCPGGKSAPGGEPLHYSDGSFRGQVLEDGTGLEVQTQSVQSGNSFANDQM